MKRQKELIIVSHCVLNQNSVINGWERAKGGFNSIIRQIIDQNIGIIQFPCPEMLFLGCNRPPMEKEEYNCSDYRKLCTVLADEQIMTLGDYIENGYKILGLIGIKNSPSCDTLGKQGVFMEIFLERCQENNIHFKTMDIPEDYVEGETDFRLIF